MRAKVSDWRSLCLRTSAKWTYFVARSLHRKFPFLTQVRDGFDDWVVGSQFRSLPSPSRDAFIGAKTDLPEKPLAKGNAGSPPSKKPSGRLAKSEGF
jgi:hypothetical protein